MRRLALRSTLLAALLFVGSIAVGQEGAGNSAAKRLDQAREAAIEKAKQDFLQIRKKELATWLAEHERALTLAKAAGDQEGIDYLTDAIERSKRAGYAVLPAPKDAVEFQGNRYAFFSDKVPFHVARIRCERMGGHLVTVETKDEETFVAATFGDRQFWAGATDANKEGTWAWFTGRPFKPVAFKTQFNNSDGRQHGLVWQANGKRWEDAYEGLGIAFVCEWER